MGAGVTYTDEQLVKYCIDAIKKHNLTFISYVFSYVPFVRSTYDERLVKTGKSESIKKALEKNRINKKKKRIDHWEDSENATLQLAWFKLHADEDELDRLNTQKIDHSNKGKEFDFKNTDTNELIAELEKLLGPK